MSKKVTGDLSWEQAGIIWWGFFWRQFFAAFLAMLPWAFVVEPLLGEFGSRVSGPYTMLVMVFSGIWAVKEVFAKMKHRNFSLAIVVEETEAPAQDKQP